MFGPPPGWLLPKPHTFREIEDAVQHTLDTADAGDLALLYKSLYARGYRLDQCNALIAKRRKALPDR
jgi:hypothetical protein